MMKMVQVLLCYGLLLTMFLALNEARPSGNDAAADTDALVQPDVEDVRAAYAGYEMPAQAIYPNIPMERLETLYAQYRPTAYQRSPSYGNLNELYRLPESKRQTKPSLLLYLLFLLFLPCLVISQSTMSNNCEHHQLLQDATWTLPHQQQQQVPRNRVSTLAEFYDSPATVAASSGPRDAFNH
ncbi:hypothetical protein ACLKA7_003002 [Drosophila subpalustris]